MTAKTEISAESLSEIGNQMPQGAVVGVDHTKLKISFHGRIIDHLGIQMYQSPVAAIAEIISNSWDAEAEKVDVLLPGSLGPTATFKISDNGNGMTFDQCQERFLAVGRNRRVNESDVTTEKQRPILGRKGIGKFAGFGIAKIIHVATIARETGEKTVFQLDLDQLRAGKYIETDGVLDVIEYLGPDETRKAQHSTIITLNKLSLGKTPNSAQFSKSMARRFALRNQLQDFAVSVDGSPLVDPEDVAEIDMLFPRDYTPEKLTEHGIEVDGEWGKETLGDGNPIWWRVAFYKKPIGDEDLRGISVFAHVKLAQRPFEFNVTVPVGSTVFSTWPVEFAPTTSINLLTTLLLLNVSASIGRSQKQVCSWHGDRRELESFLVYGEIRGAPARWEQLSSSLRLLRLVLIACRPTKEGLSKALSARLPAFHRWTKTIF